MYLCENCGSYFEEPTWVRENMGEHFGFPASETIAVCPCCGLDDYERCETCEICGKEVSEGDLDEGLCPQCAAEAWEDEQCS